VQDIFNLVNIEYSISSILLPKIITPDSQTIVSNSTPSSHSSLIVIYNPSPNSPSINSSIIDSNASTQASNILEVFKLVFTPPLSPASIKETNYTVINIISVTPQKKPVNDDTSQDVPHSIKNHKYNTITHNFKPNSVHLIDVTLEIQKQLMPEILTTLTLELKFIFMPDNHLKNLITRITVYSQHAKQILNTFVQELKNSSKVPKHNVYFSKDQKAFRKLKKSQF
jgi:hypothetical protein